MTDTGKTYIIRLNDGSREIIGYVAHLQMTMLNEIIFWQDYIGTHVTYPIRDLVSFSIVPGTECDTVSIKANRKEQIK